VPITPEELLSQVREDVARPGDQLLSTLHRNMSGAINHENLRQRARLACYGSGQLGATPL
jgi:hypothetical protein